MPFLILFLGDILQGHSLEDKTVKEKLLDILLYELNYKAEAAQVTCCDLLEIEDPEIERALNLWIKTREMTHVIAENYDAVVLTRRMHYPSALLAIDMLRKEPIRAKQLLRGFR